ncbi:MAG: hypothetical protein TRG1_732 [Flavobacteriaceae bacterium FS1-H7996/R]|nr:MAG: hypothetical protein TRG1_732 [Flavobacteriaceae bacterium FS1-H7996/R]
MGYFSERASQRNGNFTQLKSFLSCIASYGKKKRPRVGKKGRFFSQLEKI